MKSFTYFILIALLFSGCGTKKTEEKASIEIVKPRVTEVIGVGKIEPENEILHLSTEISGIIVRVFKKENDSVKVGEIILELKHDVEDANIVQLKSKIATQEAQVKADQTNSQVFKIKYDNALVELKRLQSLFDKGAETQQVVDNASTEMQTYQANIDQQNALLEVTKRKLIESKTLLKVSQEELKQKFVRAPISGVLIEMTNTAIGNQIDTKQPFAQLCPEGETIVVCEIDEMFADKIAEGQKAWIRNFGSMDTISTGTVYFISSFLKKKSLFTDQAGEKEDRRVREIKIKLDSKKRMLLNARVECVVDI